MDYLEWEEVIVDLPLFNERLLLSGMFGITAHTHVHPPHARLMEIVLQLLQSVVDASMTPNKRVINIMKT